MVASAKDKKAVLIEVAPDNFGVYEIPNGNQLICANHFQSAAYDTDKRNKKAIAESHSLYRYNRMTQLLAASDPLTPKKAVDILRNREGLENTPIGYGNEKALNQMLAHHGIVFQPEKQKVWVSTSPYQMGTFVAYDLHTVFNTINSKKENGIATEGLHIPEDPFIHTEAYKKYEKFRNLSKKIKTAIATQKKISEKEIQYYQQLNPEYWATYYMIGTYYYEHKKYAKASIAFKKAQTKEITTVPDRKELKKYIKKCKRKL